MVLRRSLTDVSLEPLAKVSSPSAFIGDPGLIVIEINGFPLLSSAGMTRKRVLQEAL